MCRYRLAWDAIVAREEQNFKNSWPLHPLQNSFGVFSVYQFSTVTGSSGYLLFLLFDVLLMDGVMLAGVDIDWRGMQ